jgi:hypothetical protein
MSIPHAVSEIRTVTTLVHKRDEIRASIRMYEKKLERDAAAGQAQGSSRTFNDAPAFSPSR